MRHVDAGRANADTGDVGDDADAISAKQKAAAYVGQVVSGRYRVESVVALGGMGAVFRAEHVHMRKQVALKLLHPMTENLPELVARFERESIVGAHVSHHNVCQATDFGCLEDGSHYLVLEYVQGRTLYEVLKDGRLDAPRAAEIARQMAAGLGAAHKLGIVHRDVKPANVMLCDGPRIEVKIVDFGLARLPKERFHVDEKVAVTAAGTVFGTVAYMAPELALGMHKVDHRSDLYALGVILYEMLAGKRPHEAPDAAALFKLIRTQQPPPIAERAPGAEVPPELEAIARKLLEKKPDARYQSAEELIEALDDACPPEQDPVPPARASGRGARSERGVAEVADLGDASPPPAPAALDSIPGARAPRASGGSRPWLVAALLVLVGLAGVRELAPNVWGSVMGRPAASPGPEGAGQDRANPDRAAPSVAAAATQAPGASAAVTSQPAAPASAPASASAAPSPEAYAMRFALGEAAAAHDAKRGARALLALSRSSPEAFRDHDVVANAAAVAVTAALGEPALADEVFATLGGPALGESGPDVLFHMASYYGGSRGAIRAADLLANPAVLARASPALRITRDLKAAPCRERPALYERAAADGDERTLALLGSMLASECPATPGACCAPNDPKLATANGELRKRLHK